jgi:glycerophosphoryl diester phosphodiesterase
LSIRPALATLLLGVLALGLIRALGGWIAPLFFDSLPILVIVLGGLVALWFLANLIATAFNGGFFALLIVAFAQRLVPGFEASEDLQRVPLARGRSWRISAPRAAMLLLTDTLFAGLTGAWLVQGVEVQDDVIIAAHRGAAGRAPENTLVSIRRAIEDRADWAEIDVQESADGKVVIIHDSDFMKLAGVDLKVWDGMLSQISAIDAGS